MGLSFGSRVSISLCRLAEHDNTDADAVWCYVPIDVTRAWTVAGRGRCRNVHWNCVRGYA